MNCKGNIASELPPSPVGYAEIDRSRLNSAESSPLLHQFPTKKEASQQRVPGAVAFEAKEKVSKHLREGRGLLSDESGAVVSCDESAAVARHVETVVTRRCARWK